MLAVDGPYGDFFQASTTGNPVTSVGRVAGVVAYGNLGITAAVLDTRSGSIQALDVDGSSSAADVNERGDVVGDVQGAAGSQGFYWPRGQGAPTYLEDRNGTQRTEPTAVNNFGFVVGTLWRGDDPPRAFLWDAEHGGRPLLLGTLGGDRSEAYGINDSGYVVGASTTRSDETHPFVWLPERRRMVDLDVLPGFTGGVARDINGGSFIVGEATRTLGRSRAFVWNPTTHATTALATPTGMGSAAYAINVHVVIVGGLVAPGSTVPSTGAIWNACRTPVQELRTSGDVVIATGITRQERIVGYASVRPVWWQKAGPCTPG